MISEQGAIPPAPTVRTPAWLAPITRWMQPRRHTFTSTTLAGAQNSWWRKGLALIAVALLSVPTLAGVAPFCPAHRPERGVRGRVAQHGCGLQPTHHPA